MRLLFSSLSRYKYFGSILRSSLLLLAVWVCTGLASPTHASVITLDQARAELTINGRTTFAEVTLPYGWDYQQRATSGVARFEMDFGGPVAAGEPWALYFHRLGNAYVVTFNGVVLEKNGTLEAGDFSDYSKAPRFLLIPPNLLRTNNRLEVTIRSDSGRRSGVPVVQVGPRDELEPVYRKEFALRVVGSGVFCAFSLVVGAFAFVLWISQTDPRPEQRGVRDSVYLYAALAEFAWAFFRADSLIERPPLHWQWWSIAVNMSLGAWLGALLLFCHTIAGWNAHPLTRWVRRIVVTLLVIGPAVTYAAIVLPMHILLTLWQLGFVLVFTPSAIVFIIKAFQGATFMHRLVAFVLLLNVPIAFHDFIAMRVGDSFSNDAYLRYSETLFGIALGAIAIERFRSANMRVRDMLGSLESRVVDKERELSASYQRMELIAREQERILERSRILRDMHDGVGSHISSAIRQLQSGNPDNDEILLTLRDSLDQLKLSMDALHLPPGDVAGLLATLRYRLEPRFRTVGLTLEWAVVALPVVPKMDASAMRQLQYIFFEAFSNVMQHAHASVLRIEATPTMAWHGGGQHTVRIRIQDNGRGFTETGVKRSGLTSMHERAAAIGAQIAITSDSGGTIVEILLA